MAAVRRSYFVRTKILIALSAIVVLAIGSWIICAPLLSRVVKERTVSALEENFAATLEIKDLEVKIFPRVAIVGEGIVFHLKDRPEAPPLFTIRKFTARANPLGLLIRHVSTVRLEGLDIHIPPREDNAAQQEKTREVSEQKPPRFVIDEIIADGTTLTTLPKDSWKEPLHF